MEWPVEEAPTGLRHSRVAAVAALLLILTSFWLPWWVVRYQDAAGRTYAGDEAGLFAPLDPLTHAWLPHATGFVVGVAALWLFIRLAGRSWLYEPRDWLRDLAIIAGLLASSLASALLWPQEGPSFWSHRQFSLMNATGSQTFTEQALAGLGWWCGVAAVLGLVVAWWLGRK